jgi:predicted acyltransferase
MSLDALRGFDMFWIAGGGLIVGALERWTANPLMAAVKQQLTHVAWNGFRFYDLIFPLFVFMVGASISYSVPRSLERSGRAATIRKILTRGVLLFLIGLFYSGGLSTPPAELRMLGVLNRIALCYTGAALLFVFLGRRALVGVWLALLLGYWALMGLTPIRDIRLDAQPMAELASAKGETNAMVLFQQTQARVTGQYDPGYNLANHLDFQYLPGRLYDRYYDPEGLLSTVPAIASCLLGLFAGLFVQAPGRTPVARSLGLIGAGVASVVVGSLWGLEFPVIKKLWTSSFVLVSGGYSLVLLGVFHQVIDVWGWRTWCQPFVWVGSNALTIYLAAQILGFRRIAERLAGAPAKSMFGAGADTLIALVAVLVLFAFARFLYRRQLFLRV